MHRHSQRLTETTNLHINFLVVSAFFTILYFSCYKTANMLNLFDLYPSIQAHQMLKIQPELPSWQWGLQLLLGGNNKQNFVQLLCLQREETTMWILFTSIYAFPIPWGKRASAQSFLKSCRVLARSRGVGSWSLQETCCALRDWHIWLQCVLHSFHPLRPYWQFIELQRPSNLPQLLTCQISLTNLGIQSCKNTEFIKT